MLSDSALKLAAILRAHEGPDVKGVGPDINQLISLWSDNPPEDLRPAMEELKRIGFINIDLRISAPVPAEMKPYNVRDVVGIQITEAMQSFMDQYN